jgi:hypothetical protein
LNGMLSDSWCQWRDSARDDHPPGTYMGKLKADFESDWIAHLRGQLARVWGAAEVERLLDRDVPNYYFETFRRRLARRERVIKIADNFQCPWEAEAGWRVLQNKVRQGDDLNPHLSRRHASLANNDGLLAEWGVYHFHLGLTLMIRGMPVELVLSSSPWPTTILFARSTCTRMATIGKTPSSSRAFIATGPT